MTTPDQSIDFLTEARHRGLLARTPRVKNNPKADRKAVTLRPDNLAEPAPDPISNHGLADCSRQRKAEPWRLTVAGLQAERCEQSAGMPPSVVIHLAKFGRSE